MNELAFSMGGVIVLLVLGAIRQLRLTLGLVDYDKADIEELKERLTRTEERLESEKNTNLLLQKMIDEQAKDIKRFQEQWAKSWNELQARTTELFKTRDDLHTAQTENALLTSELSGLKEKLADFDKRLTELRMQREEVAAEAEENKRLAILHQGRFEAIPQLLSQLGLDNVIQDWARAAFQATQPPETNGPEPDPDGPGGGGKDAKDKPLPITDAVSKKKIDKDDKKKAA